MTNTIPASMTDIDARTMIRDTIIALTAAIARDANRITDPTLNPYDLYSDNDDYTPCAASALHTLIANAFGSEHDNALIALAALINNPDFTDDMNTIDCDTPMHTLIPDPFDD